MCDRKAEWTIVDGPSPDNYTEACTEHVGDLLTDAAEHRISRFDSNGDPEALCCYLGTYTATGVRVPSGNL